MATLTSRPQEEGRTKRAASKAAWAGKIASVMIVLVGCPGANDGSETQEEAEAPSAAPPKPETTARATSEGREVRIEMVAKDAGESLQIDGFEPREANGDLTCEAGIEWGRIQSCAYTPAKGFTGTDEFEYTVKDANGKTEPVTVHVRVKPAS